jgi:ferredoxin-thioredoxin reductase catalytic chain
LTTLEEVRRRAENDAKNYGYYLNPEPEFLIKLIEGLKKNEDRYGYPSCPCRLASGKLELDRDIICPCDYRDQDVEEYGCCYCALYVRRDVHEGKIQAQPIPERRTQEIQARAYGIPMDPKLERTQEKVVESKEFTSAKMKLWYCKQCGYVCYREGPPYICPICKAKKEVFSEIELRTEIVKR